MEGQAYSGRGTKLAVEELGNQHLTVIETRTALARVLRCLGEYARLPRRRKKRARPWTKFDDPTLLGWANRVAGPEFQVLVC